MQGVVIIPWRDRVDRRQQLDWVVDAYTSTGWVPVIGETPPDAEWCKADAVMAGLTRFEAEAGYVPATLAVVDADVWAPGLDDAYAEVANGHRRWAMPHTSVYRLTAEATVDALEQSPHEVRRRLHPSKLDRSPYRGVDAGGAFVIGTAEYLTAPLDARFVGWGHEDMAAGLVWSTLFGAPRRFPDPLIHLWHEPQPKLSAGVGSRSSKLLYDRIRAASGRRGRMMELVEEGKQWRAVAERTQTGTRSGSTVEPGGPCS